MHLGMLAVTLKVPTRQLEALENDQYEVFRGPAFVRATAQAMCRHLGIDPAPVLAGLPQNATSMAVQTPTMASSVRPALRPARASRGPGLSRQVLLLGALMLLGAAALIWWPTPAPTPAALNVVPPDAMVPATDASAAEGPVSVNVPSVPEASASEPAALSPVPATVPNASPAPVAPPTRAVPAPAPAPAVAAPVAAQTPAPQAQSPSARKSDGKSDLQIAATGDTWLEVRDARGQLVVNRLLKAGETQPVDLPPPFSVVVGRAHLAKVTQGGKDFDLTPHTKESTARFEIQP